MTDQIIINGYDHNTDKENNLKSFAIDLVLDKSTENVLNHKDINFVTNRKDLNLKCYEPIYEDNHEHKSSDDLNHVESAEDEGLQSNVPEGENNSVGLLDSKYLNTGEETVLVQDTGFSIKIQSPGVSEAIELAVSSVELVQEILQVLIDREDTCSRTCFTLQLDGVTLDNFAELKSIEGLQEGSILKVVEELYTVREARIHVRHICDLLKSLDLHDAYTGIDCSSLTFVNTITNGNVAEKKQQKLELSDWMPPEHILPCSKDRPLLPLHPVFKDLKGPQCLKILTYSGWNPPPGPRRMHGDLLYLFVVTMEDKRVHITSSTQGFFLNQCTMETYDPKPSGQKHVHHSLVDLLNQISPIFKRNFQTLLKKRQQKHPFERVVTPYQVHSWLSPNFEHTIDYIRAEDAFSSRLGYEEHIPGQTRDWNEELQTTRDLPRKTLPERLIRERTVFKVHSDFVGAAVRGAMSVVDGNIMAINPGEDTKMQMFLWNNIFLSLGFDVKDHFKEFGGDHAAYTAPGCDLQGVKAYTGADIEGLHTLGTVVVDYRGYRVTAQSIIPGILEKEQEQSVVYGSIDFGKTIVSNDKYKELLEKAAQPLKIRSHKVLNGKGEEIELASSVECKGIIGNDGRYYILDLLRTFAPDVNFLPIDEELFSERVRELKFPRKHRHRLSCLRQELVETFFENRYVSFVKLAAQQFQQLRLKKLEDSIHNKLEKKSETEEVVKQDEDTTESQSKEAGNILSNLNQSEEAGNILSSLNQSEEAGNILSNLNQSEEAGSILSSLKQTIALDKPVNLEPALTDMSKLASILDDEIATKEIIRTAARAVNSLSDEELCIQFNTDVFQEHVKHAHPQSETLKKEEQLAIQASEFILFNQIPHFVAECLEHASCPIDPFTLTETLHNLGINMRYLGVLTDELAKYPQLSYLHSICIMSLILRAAKHLFKPYMQGVDSINLAAAISHFLNCFLASYPNPHDQMAPTNEEKPRKKNKRRIKILFNDNTEWTNESPKGFWKKITDEVQEYYGYKIDGESIDHVCDKYSIHKVNLLRAFCKSVGIQLLLREYALDNKTKPTFTDDDVVNVFPIVKHIQPKASDAFHVFTTGQAKIQQGLLHEGYELIGESMNLLNNVYGALHYEMAACARLLARLSYIMGDYNEALVYQQRAVLMSERVLGIDHANTITEYAHLALYCFATNQTTNALKLMYRSLYLATLCGLECHPDVALYYNNIGLMLHSVPDFDLSLKFLNKALEINLKLFGPKHVKYALGYHLIARTYSCKGDFRSALQSEKEAYSIYKLLLGEDNERTRESSECLKHLIQQAVKLQKTFNQLSKGEKISSLSSLQIQTPTHHHILEALNLINGIMFVHISAEDIEKFKEEVIRNHALQQQLQQLKTTTGTAATMPAEKLTSTKQDGYLDLD